MLWKAEKCRCWTDNTCYKSALCWFWSLDGSCRRWEKCRISTDVSFHSCHEAPKRASSHLCINCEWISSPPCTLGFYLTFLPLEDVSPKQFFCFVKQYFYLFLFFLMPRKLVNSVLGWVLLTHNIRRNLFMCCCIDRNKKRCRQSRLESKCRSNS